VAEEFGRELLERAASLGSATIHEAAGRIGALPAGIRPVDPSSRVAGPARTVAGAPGDNLAIHLDPQASGQQNDGQQVFLVVAEDMLHSDVRRGENAGRALEHNGVVRQLVPVAKIDSPATGFSSTVAVHAAREWNRANLGAVVFVQERHSRRVVASAAIPFPKA